MQRLKAMDKRMIPVWIFDVGMRVLIGYAVLALVGLHPHDGIFYLAGAFIITGSLAMWTGIFVILFSRKSHVEERESE